MTVSEQLRKIVRECGETTYRVGTNADLNIRTIDRFVKEGMPAHSDTFDALCDYFGLELAEKKTRTTPKQAARKTGTTVKRATKKTATKRKRRKKSAK